MRQIHKLTGWLGDVRRRLTGDGDRRGSVIVVVLALLGSLSLLGFLIYTISAQEETNAEYFANSDSAKVQQDSGGCNVQFDRALRQIILGADFNEYNSGLWGGRHSLLATMFGRDLHPFSGHGINATYAQTWKPSKTYTFGQFVRPTRLFAGALDQHYRCTTAGLSGGGEPAWGGSPVNDGPVVWELEPTFEPFIDQNYNDIPDDPINDPPAPANIQDLLEINLSPAAQNAILDLDDPTRPFPEPDVDYTYADINNVFLQHEEQVPFGTNDPFDVVVPSFGRPAFLRNVSPPANWHDDPLTVTRVLRPHHQHVAYTSEGDNSGLQRFYNTVDHGPFPLVTDPDTGDPISINGPFPFPAPAEAGIWSNPVPGADAIDYGADPDGDGVNEAFFIDLGAPIQETPDGSQTFVPLFAITIKSLDSLVNLNTAGNLAGGVDTDGDNLFDNPLGDPLAGPGTVPYLSRSNQAVAPSEVNPEWPLVARPVLGGEGGLDSALPGDLDAALEQHRLIFRTPADNNINPVDGIELANMELYMLLSGRGQMVPGSPDPMVDPAVVTDVYAGRWGEDFGRLLNGLQTQNPLDFPFAGTSGDPPLTPFDDNSNSGEGFAFNHPFDYQAGGRYTLAGTFGKTREFAPPIENRQFPVYTNYVTQLTLGYRQTNMLHGGVLMPGIQITGLLVNEPTETSVEPVLAAQQQDDDIFGPGDNVLQLSDNDRSNLGNPGRAPLLAPYNFGADLVNDRQEAIRKRFTSSSFDLFAYGKQVFLPLGGDLSFRDWEFSANDPSEIDFDYPEANVLAVDQFEFPPDFGGTNYTAQDPFRRELRDLLRFEKFDRDDTQRKLQRKLSVNGVLDRDPNGDLRFRPLTPHPAGLGRDPIVPSTSFPEDLTPGNLQQQEWLARFDRQRMARDIYVLLYTLGGGIDQDYTQDNNPEGLYTQQQTREMAQFAVNFVDALDTDDIVTLFEYDFNLNDGWNLNDNPFDDDGEGDSDDQLGNHRVVYGVEAQQLAFNEAFVIVAKRVKVGAGTDDHDATEYNDEKHRDFTFIELENVSPNPVTFENSAWQIVIKPADAASALVVTGERRLTITNFQSPVPSGAGVTTPRLTIGTVGDTDNVDPMSGAQLPSHFRVDTDGIDTDGNGEFEYVSFAPPAPNVLDLDLIVDSVSRYRIHEPQTAGEPGDGSEVTVVEADPPGQEFLQLIPEGLPSETDTLDSLIEGNVKVELQLRRRANPTRQEPEFFDSDPTAHKAQSADNPWVVVDTMRVELQAFVLEEADVAADIQDELNNLQSSERRQPLYGPDNDLELTPTDASFVANTLTTVNRAATAAGLPYKLWQPHFDRNYTSVMELFNLPLFGPFRDLQNTVPVPALQPLIDNQVTRKLGSRSTPAAVWNATPPILPVPDLNDARLVGTDTAGYRFLHPEGADSREDPLVVPDPTDDDNLWYRLLAFLEVPSRSHQDPASPDPEVMQIGQIGSVPSPQFFRSPGKIDLNTLRHHEVLAALLDDREVFRNDELDTVAGTKAYLFDLAADPASFGGTRRDWWEQFLLARDRVDPIVTTNPAVPIALPGSPAAKPFRSLGFSLRGKHSLEDTIFRHLPKDDNPADVPPSPDRRRRLFELGTELEHNGDPGTPAQPVIDYDVRHRLLQKVLNNSTNRSNAFAVFIEVRFFEAAEVNVTIGPDVKQVVRIGSELTGDAFAPCRGFFVIDRSRAFDLVRSEHLPQNHEHPPGSSNFFFTYSFDRSFPWDSLVLYRQLLP